MFGGLQCDTSALSNRALFFHSHDSDRKIIAALKEWPGSTSADDLSLIAPEIPSLNEYPEDDPRKEEGEEIFDPGEIYSQAPSTEPPPETGIGTRSLRIGGFFDNYRRHPGRGNRVDLVGIFEPLC